MRVAANTVAVAIVRRTLAARMNRAIATDRAMLPTPMRTSYRLIVGESRRLESSDSRVGIDAVLRSPDMSNRASARAPETRGLPRTEVLPTSVAGAVEPLDVVVADAADAAEPGCTRPHMTAPHRLCADHRRERHRHLLGGLLRPAHVPLSVSLLSV